MKGRYAGYSSGYNSSLRTHSQVTKKQVSMGLVIGALALFAFMVGIGQTEGIALWALFPP